MKLPLATIVAAAALSWSVLSVAAQTNDSIQIKAIHFTSDGEMNLDLVLSADLMFSLEHSTDLVRWRRFPEPPPDQIQFIAYTRHPAGPLRLHFPRESMPLGSAHFFRCRILEFAGVLDPLALPVETADPPASP